MKLCWSAGSACVNGLELAYETAGPEHGDPLIMIMGLGGQLIHWPDALCEELADDGFRLIRFDNRDAGLSADADHGVPVQLSRDWLRARAGLASRANYTLHDMADDAIGILDALAIRKAHVVGVSMGGMIAQIVAARYPDRVRSLTSVMSTTNHPKLPSARFDVLWRMAGLGPKPTSREDVIRYSTAMLNRVGSPHFPTPADYRRQLVGRAYDRAFRPRGIARQTQAILATGSFEDLLPSIAAPTQIVHGLSDPLLRPACGRRSAQLIRTSRLELIDGMGHDFALPLMPRWSTLIGQNAARA